MTYKVGDIVRRVGSIPNERCVVTEVDKDYRGRPYYRLVHENGNKVNWSWYDNELATVKRSQSNSFIKNTVMSILEKFKMARKSEPQKSLIKAGILDQDERFTDEGRIIFDTWLVGKLGEEFRTEVVVDLLKEDEETKTK